MCHHDHGGSTLYELKEARHVVRSEKECRPEVRDSANWLKISRSVSNIIGNNFLMGLKSVGHLAGHWVTKTERPFLCKGHESEKRRNPSRRGISPFTFLPYLFNTATRTRLRSLASTGRNTRPVDYRPIRKLFP